MIRDSLRCETGRILQALDLVDFDGIEGHAELPDCSYMYRLIDALHSAGFKEDAIEKICYKNALRFYRELL